MFRIIRSIRVTDRLKPRKLIFFKGFANKKDVIRREKYFKTSKGRGSLKQIIRESFR